MGSLGNTPVQACNCIGPQNGERLCPCMLNQHKRQEAEWLAKYREKVAVGGEETATFHVVMRD